MHLDEERSCILVIMGADEEGNKEFVAMSDGYKESKVSWREVMLGSEAPGAARGGMRFQRRMRLFSSTELDNISVD